MKAYVCKHIHRFQDLRKKATKLAKLEIEWSHSKTASDASLKHPILYTSVPLAIVAFAIPGAISTVVSYFMQSAPARGVAAMAVFSLVTFTVTICIEKTRRSQLYRESDFEKWASKHLVGEELQSCQFLCSVKEHADAQNKIITTVIEMFASVLFSVFSAFISFTYFDPISQEEVITSDNLCYFIIFSILLALACQAISFLTKITVELAFPPSPAFIQALIEYVAIESSTRTTAESITEDQTPTSQCSGSKRDNSDKRS